MSEGLAAKQRELGAPRSGAAVASALRLGDPRTRVVVAGQQPVLLGGPHLVITKALSAVALARRLEEQRGAPVVPVFWNASEDHDHVEVDHVWLDLGDGPERRRVPLPGDGRMLSRTPVPPEGAALAASVAAELPDGPGAAEIRSLIRPEPSDTMGDWFARILLGLLGRFGLVVVEPPWLGSARALMWQEVNDPGALAASITRAEDAVAETGAPRPLALPRPHLFFVVDERGVRRRVHLDGATWRAEGGATFTRDELWARFLMDPTSVSWNVAGRVLAQNLSLPVEAHVCGPAEIRYASLLAEAHLLVGAVAPRLVLRPSVTVVEPRIARACETLGVDPAAVATRGEAAFAPVPVPQEPEAIRRLAELAQELPEGGSTAARRRRANVLREVELYRAAMSGEAREKADVHAERRRRVLGALRPNGRMQERELSPLPWLARYGLGVLDEWLELVSGAEGQHRVLRLGGQ